MKNIKLKLSRLLFSWYYKRCGDFFDRWHFIKSVKILIQNYEHQTLLYNNAQKHIDSLRAENSKQRKELFDIKMKQVATDEQIDWVNKGFGMGINKDSVN